VAWTVGVVTLITETGDPRKDVRLLALGEFVPFQAVL